MAVDIAFYKVVKEIAIRSGLIEERYRTKDNHYILDNKDLSRVRFTTDEYISGLDGVERIPDDMVETLIAEGGYKFGYDGIVDENDGTQAENVEETDTSNVDETDADENGDETSGETGDETIETLENDDEQEQVNENTEE